MPSAPFVVPPLLLALILVVSGVAKIKDPADTRSTFYQLGLPAFLNRIKLPRLLPWGELALAVLLLVVPGHWYLLPATLSLLLFSAYWGVVARALRFDHPVTCGCFGRLGLGLITRNTVWRNAWLVGTALVTWLDAWRGVGVLQRLRHLDGSWWWLATTLLAVIVTGVIVHNEAQSDAGDTSGVQVMSQDSDGFPLVPVPYAVLDTPEGHRSVWQLSDVAARLLVFCDPDDATSSGLDEQVSRWATDLPAVQVHVVGPSSWERLANARPTLAEHLLGDADGTLSDRLEVTAPGAVILGTDRLLAGGPVHGFDNIEELVAEAAEVLREHASG